LNALDFRHTPLQKQYIIALGLTSLVALICYSTIDWLGYRVVALLLMVTVSLSAMIFEIMPVLLTAIFSALIWNFFFIPPKFTLTIGNAEDALMFLMYFIIALMNAVLITRIRRIEKEANKKEEKENTLRLYNTMFNSLSHELKTPIAAIITATDNLQSLADKLNESQKHDLLQNISNASQRLNRQVNNLLNMSRLESGVIQPRLDWFDARELVHDVINSLASESNGKPIHVSANESLPLFKSDFGLLWQVLHNLIHNAIHHIPKYSIVTIRIASHGYKLILIVEDTGNGFTEDEKVRVFEKFYRLNSSRPGGTGLGLSIVKGFTEALHGTVKLANTEEGGAQFILEIPCEISYHPNTE